MEPHPAERPEVELLEPDPPGVLERFATAVGQRRGARAAAALAVGAVVAVGVVVGLTDEAPDPSAQAAAEDVPAAAPLIDDADRVPPPWVTSGRSGWDVLAKPRVNLRSPVYVVTFAAVNRTGEAQTADGLRAVGRFVGRPGFRFSATCTGFDKDSTGALRPVRSAVEPGEKILVRCTDKMEYSGNRPRLVRASLEVQGVPCESGGGRPEVF